MSMTTFKLQLGIGPHITRIGSRFMIAVEDELAWREMMRHPSGKAAKLAVASETILRNKSKVANARKAEIAAQRKAEAGK